MAMTEVEPTEDNYGTGQWPVLLRFEAHIVMAHRGPTTKMEVRKAAMALATWLHQLRHFGQGDEIQVIACEPDEFAPVADKFMAWRVEFVVGAAIGETAWKNDGTIPTDVLFSWSPEIGNGNAEKYEPIADATP